MENKITLRPFAKLELGKALIWYEHQQLGLAKKFWKEYSSCIELIIFNPHLFPIHYKNYRKIVMKNFPYSIIYFHDKSEIVVLAVFHQKRNPKTWKRRG